MAPKAAKEKAPAAKKIAPKKTPTKKAAKDGKPKKEKDPNAPKVRCCGLHLVARSSCMSPVCHACRSKAHTVYQCL